jgi:hypothetical protein
MLLTDDEQSAQTIIGGVRVYPIRAGIERLQTEYHGSAILYPEGSGTTQARDAVRQMCRAAELDFLSVDLRVRPEGMQEGLRVNPLAMRNRPELSHSFP